MKTTTIPDQKPLKGVPKNKRVEIQGDRKMIRACVLCPGDLKADAKADANALSAYREIRKHRISWGQYSLIWKVIVGAVTQNKAVPSIESVYEVLPDDYSKDSLRMVGVLPPPRRVDIDLHLEGRVKKAEEREHKDAQMVAAAISTKGAEVDGRTWKGPEHSAKYLAREKERIFGVKDPTAPVKHDGPTWPVTLPGKGGNMPAPRIAANTHALFDFHGIKIRQNLMKASQEIVWDRYERDDDRAFCDIKDLMEGYKLCPSTERLHEHMVLCRTPHHPVADWIRSKPWDGKQRLTPLLETLTFDSNVIPALAGEHLANMVATWLISAVQAAFLPAHPPGNRGVSAQGMLVLAGAQGIGKTRWLKALTPPWTDWFAEATRLDPDNKDSVAAATGAWLVELGELDATFRRADIAALKGYITSPVDTYRSPYGRVTEDHPRRTIYCGSVNEHTYLRDSTGNRRFWTIPILQADPEALAALDVQQVWAEAARWLENGINPYLPKETEDWLRDWNRGHEEIPLSVQEFLIKFQADPDGRVSGIEIKQALGPQCGQREIRDIGSYLRHRMGLVQKKVRGVRMWPISRKPDQPPADMDISHILEED